MGESMLLRKSLLLNNKGFSVACIAVFLSLMILLIIVQNKLTVLQGESQFCSLNYVIYRLPSKLSTVKKYPTLLKVPEAKNTNRDYISLYMLNGEKIRIKCRDAFIRIDFIETKNNKYVLAEIKLTIIDLNNRTKTILANEILINKETREVFLLNGTRIGITAVWLPLSWLNHGKSMRISETLGMKSIKYSPMGEYLADFKWLGWRKAYVISADMYDSEAAILMTKDDILSKKETKYWKVLKVYKKYSKELGRNATFALILWKTDNSTEEIPLESNFKRAKLKRGYYLIGVNVYDAETGLANHLPVIDPLLAALGIKINFEDFYLYKYEIKAIKENHLKHYIDAP